MIEAYHDTYDGGEAWDITDVNLDDLLAFLHRRGLNPSMYTIEYAHCGSHTVILKRITEDT